MPSDESDDEFLKEAACKIAESLKNADVNFFAVDFDVSSKIL